jgi:hypothetical protein
MTENDGRGALQSHEQPSLVLPALEVGKTKVDVIALKGGERCYRLRIIACSNDTISEEGAETAQHGHHDSCQDEGRPNQPPAEFKGKS